MGRRVGRRNHRSGTNAEFAEQERKEREKKQWHKQECRALFVVGEEEPGFVEQAFDGGVRIGTRGVR